MIAYDGIEIDAGPVALVLSAMLLTLSAAVCGCASCCLKGKSFAKELRERSMMGPREHAYENVEVEEIPNVRRKVEYTALGTLGLAIVIWILYLAGVFGQQHVQSDVDQSAVYLDGWNPIEVPPKLVEGFASEMFYSQDIESNKVKVNDTHAYLPFGFAMQANYYWRKPHMDDYEFGIAKWYMDYNMLASMNKNITLGTGEKLHALYRHNGPAHAQVDRVRRISKQRLAGVSWLARKIDPARRYLTLLYIAMIKGSSQMKEVGAMNDRQQQPIHGFSMENDGMLDNQSVMMAKAGEMHDKLNEFFANEELNITDFQMNYIACMHWTHSDYDADGMWVEFGRKYPAYRGHLTFAPFSLWECLGGTSVFFHNKKTKRLEIYYGAAIHSHFFDISSEERKKPILLLGPADGDQMDVPSPTRTNPTRPSMLSHLMYLLVQSLPVDYTYMFPKNGDDCPVDQYNELDDYMVRGDWPALQRRIAQRQRPGTLELLRMLSWLNLFGDCERRYLYPPPEFEGAFGLNIYVGIALFHGLVEVPPESIMVGLCNLNDHWNVIHLERV